MKDILKLAFILLIAGIVMIFSGVFFINYTGAAIGVLILGLGATIVLGKETKLKKEVYLIMWFVILILVAVLIGYGGTLPKITFG